MDDSLLAIGPFITRSIHYSVILLLMFINLLCVDISISDVELYFLSVYRLPSFQSRQLIHGWQYKGEKAQGA